MESVNKLSYEFNLWDGIVKPVDTYFCEAGKKAYFSAFENNDEMKRAFEENNWISLTFTTCYQSSKKPLGTKKNWLLKFFYEYIISRYSIRMATNEHTLVLLTKLSSATHDGVPILPYPDCLNDDKHPILHFLSRIKDILPAGYSEVSYPILKDIVHYIYNVYFTHCKDVSRESWLYDKSLYVDTGGKPNKYDEVKAKLVGLAEFSDCLTK